jgi:GGDEF domain-containing protein
VTCSVGLACWDFQEAGDELVERADQALYAAKAEGRNRHALA